MNIYYKARVQDKFTAIVYTVQDVPDTEDWREIKEHRGKECTRVMKAKEARALASELNAALHVRILQSCGLGWMLHQARTPRQSEMIFRGAGGSFSMGRQ